MKGRTFSRRRALAAYGSLMAGSPVLDAQQLIGEPPGRIAPASELVNAYEFEGMAKRILGSAVSAQISSGDRKAMDRITFNPRMMVNTLKLDLTTPLFGENLFAPVLIGPASEHKRFHPEGELAMVRGAAEAKPVIVVSDRSSFPIDEIAAQTKTASLVSSFCGAGHECGRRRIDRAVKAGCKVVIITVGVSGQSASGVAIASAGRLDAIDRTRQGISVPVVLKGIMTAEDARSAVSRGMQGMVVSNYRLADPGTASGIHAFPAIADAVADKAPILVDGGFARGSDVLKAWRLEPRV